MLPSVTSLMLSVIINDIATCKQQDQVQMWNYYVHLLLVSQRVRINIDSIHIDAIRK